MNCIILTLLRFETTHKRNLFVCLYEGVGFMVINMKCRGLPGSSYNCTSKSKPDYKINTGISQFSFVFFNHLP